ncbi:uncharacterized protein SPSK_03624 [Sporothrix schenckii 1099-18]|uniref:Uncharacterized protein n=1 Tax=Sporothrix schenckii 1099-18 TaxID=1397361 RepID=A0A0F2M3D0_SPOSC|nr:uncharacterized protein SPSK_03624 [Sporothrix schenckii 1099-18]KJR82646.1 hypothetical protein SPSK_03624 [Sporothrix schenckii 1099-18]
MAFQLKRKRSDSELSFSCSTTLSSPPRPTADFGSSPSPSDDVTTLPAIFRGRGTPLHFNSRTLKRYRDSRPSEAEVHEHTLKLLYSAQQSGRVRLSSGPGQNRQQMVGLGGQDGQDSQHDLPALQGQHSLGLDSVDTDQNQRSLHSFWNIAQPVSRQRTPLVIEADGYTPGVSTMHVSQGPNGATVYKEVDSVMG